MQKSVFGPHLGDLGVGIWVQKVVRSSGKVFYLNYWKGEGKGCGHSEMLNGITCTPNSGVGHAWLHANFGCFPPSPLEIFMGLWRSYGKLIMCALCGLNLAAYLLPHHESHGLKLGHPWFSAKIWSTPQTCEWKFMFKNSNSNKSTCWVQCSMLHT
jgi:hypothetical protein